MTRLNSGSPAGPAQQTHAMRWKNASSSVLSYGGYPSGNELYDTRRKSCVFENVALHHTVAPIPASRTAFYFEVTLTSGGNVAVGLLFCSTQVMGFPGWHPTSVGYRSKTGNFLGSSTTKGEAYGPPYGAGDVVGCVVNLAQKSMCFSVNGRALGIRQFPRCASDKVFPCVGMACRGTTVVANLGSEPFRFPQTRGSLLRGSLCDTISRALDNEYFFPDVCFTFKGTAEVVMAHRAVLGARSSQFESVFANMQAEDTAVTFVNVDVEPTLFRSLLKYIYGGRVRIRSKEHAKQLLSLASVYGVDGLLSACNRALFEHQFDKPYVERMQVLLFAFRNNFANHTSLARRYSSLLREKGVTGEQLVTANREKLREWGVTESSHRSHIFNACAHEIERARRDAGTTYSFYAQEISSRMACDIFRLVGSESFADLWFVRETDERVIPAHRVILAATSPYFRRVLQEKYLRKKSTSGSSSTHLSSDSPEPPTGGYAVILRRMDLTPVGWFCPHSADLPNCTICVPLKAPAAEDPTLPPAPSSAVAAIATTPVTVPREDFGTNVQQEMSATSTPDLAQTTKCESPGKLSESLPLDSLFREAEPEMALATASVPASEIAAAANPPLSPGEILSLRPSSGPRARSVDTTLAASAGEDGEIRQPAATSFPPSTTTLTTTTTTTTTMAAPGTETEQRGIPDRLSRSASGPLPSRYHVTPEEPLSSLLRTVRDGSGSASRRTGFHLDKDELLSVGIQLTDVSALCELGFIAPQVVFALLTNNSLEDAANWLLSHASETLDVTELERIVAERMARNRRPVAQSVHTPFVRGPISALRLAAREAAATAAAKAKERQAEEEHRARAEHKEGPNTPDDPSARDVFVVSCCLCGAIVQRHDVLRSLSCSHRACKSCWLRRISHVVYQREREVAERNHSASPANTLNDLPPLSASCLRCLSPGCERKIAMKSLVKALRLPVPDIDSFFPIDSICSSHKMAAARARRARLPVRVSLGDGNWHSSVMLVLDWLYADHTLGKTVVPSESWDVAALETVAGAFEEPAMLLTTLDSLAASGHLLPQTFLHLHRASMGLLRDGPNPNASALAARCVERALEWLLSSLQWRDEGLTLPDTTGAWTSDLTAGVLSRFSQQVIAKHLSTIAISAALVFTNPLKTLSDAGNLYTLAGHELESLLAGDPSPLSSPAGHVALLSILSVTSATGDTRIENRAVAALADFTGDINAYILPVSS